jgi:hypothetical protein
MRFSHGLGDVVQFSVILKHLRRRRPDWTVDVQCGIGKHSALWGLCHRVYHDREPVGNHYDNTFDLGWFENYNSYTDRPNSKITNCLSEVFGLMWEPDLGTYQINVNPHALEKATSWLESNKILKVDGKFRAVLIHYQGNTSPDRKNVNHWQALDIIEHVIRCGRVPVVLDWDGRSPFIDHKRILSPGLGPDDIWGGFGSGDAAVIAALTQQCEAFIGIDSGPGKCASSTQTPTLICWKGHHPVQFHDPAPNTTHLIPAKHRDMSPCGGHPQIADFFENHYRYTTYADEGALVKRACEWLNETLGVSPTPLKTVMRLLMPNGIGDSMWALLKARSIVGTDKLHIDLSGNPSNHVDQRAVPFLKRFSFVEDVRVSDIRILRNHEHPPNEAGRYDYIADGPFGSHYALIPNRPLEHGERIETWMPDYPIDWDVIKEFSFEGTERGDREGKAMAPFAAFYLGPESGHCDEGHNWKWLWEPKHWIQLGAAFARRGLKICVVGAQYDRPFWEKYVRDGVEQDGQSWEDRCGEFEIGDTFAFLKHAKFLISYQCGLGIVLHYLGGKVAMWWRPDQDSLHPRYKICFDDRMKDAWIRPGWEKNYLGLMYRKETPLDIVHMIDERGWCE